MLNSPRGLDIHGHPIDWQEAKRRMLDYHGKNQITHAEEIAAIPHVFDVETARKALWHEEVLAQSARAGLGIRVNVEGNNTSWHNEDGHAKPFVTEEGTRTRMDGPGGVNWCGDGSR
jgi:hypothetical protein